MQFTVPYTCEESIDNVRSLIGKPGAVNQNVFLQKCTAWFEKQYPGYKAFMTSSCTRALEMIAFSLDLKEGDEIIMSPFTYVGVGNAFANYGARLVYVDVDAQTMNIDASLIEKAITARTRAIIAMHYASIPCELDKITDICDRHKIALIEDNAQGITNRYKNKLLGSYGDYSCISFDSQKNISCNEGGVLLVRHERLQGVESIYDNGTNKADFSRGLVPKYEWVRKGSKFIMSEYTAAVLHPLLEKSETIVAQRKKVWDSLFEKISREERLRPYIPLHMLQTPHNAHVAFLKFKDTHQRKSIMQFLDKAGIPNSFHYVPLDDSAEGRKAGQTDAVCAVSLEHSQRLLRLPMHNYLTEAEQDSIVNALLSSTL